MYAEQSFAVKSLLHIQEPFTHLPFDEQSLEQSDSVISSTKEEADDSTAPSALEFAARERFNAAIFSH